MEKLHQGAMWSFRIRVYTTMIFLSFFLAWFVVPAIAVLFSFFGGGNSGLSSGPIFLAIFVYLIFIIIVGEIYARLAYKYWKYEFTKSELRLERGIIWKRYSNIPYERIQNIDIHRGILARILGFSTLNIQTAGYSGGYQRSGIGGYSMSEGHIPAVSKEGAEKIREWVMHKITGKKSGL